MTVLGSSCIFPTPNLERALEFYGGMLGFEAVSYLECEEPHVCLYLDDAELILLQARADRVIPNRELYGYGYDGYFYTNDPGRLEEAVRAAGARTVRPLDTTDYQNREFVVEDPDGRWIAFGVKVG